MVLEIYLGVLVREPPWLGNTTEVIDPRKNVRYSVELHVVKMNGNGA